MEAMTALMDQTSSSAMTTHVCQSNLSALDDFTKTVLQLKDFVFQWKNGVTGRLIVQMARTRMLVCLLNVLKIISSAQITNAFQMFGSVMEMMTAVITRMNKKIVLQGNALMNNSSAQRDAAFP